MSVQLAPLLRGKATQSAGNDDATGTATVAAIEATEHLVLGVEAHYDIGVSAIKTITLKHGSTTWVVFRWDFTNGPFIFNLPVALKASQNEAVTAALEASGTNGRTGYVTLFTATN